MNRRYFLLNGIAAPAIVRMTSLMQVKPFWYASVAELLSDYPLPKEAVGWLYSYDKMGQISGIDSTQAIMHGPLRIDRSLHAVHRWVANPVSVKLPWNPAQHSPGYHEWAAA